jgi:HEAT repeat protein
MDESMGKLILAIVSGWLAVSAHGHARSSDWPRVDQSRADELVRQLREFPASLPAAGRSDGSVDPVEERRRRVYAQLRKLGAEALPALASGLGDPDVQVRRNVALFLNVTSGSWSDSSQPRLDIQACLPALIAALQDRDARVRGLAAQAIGEIGPNAARAVPALITLLTDSEEGSRNSACIGLTGIGPAAKAALPALRIALSDPSADVRRFAQRAIDKIDVPR